MDVKNKLSFKGADECISVYKDALSALGNLEMLEIISFYTENEDCDVEYTFAVSAGCLCIKEFDLGRYCFHFPYELDGGSDISAALSAVVEYAILERVPIIFSGVERELLSVFFDAGYRHIDVDAISPECDAYRVRIKTECELISDVPEVSDGELSLSPLSDGDTKSYAALSRDTEINKFWGYDFSEDFPDATDAYFIETAREEFADCSAITLAVRLSGEFIGEAVLHLFDGKGGAEIGIRLLSEYQGKGYGRRALMLLLSLASKIGLVRLFGRVHRENLCSVALFSSVSDFREDDGDAFIYEILLAE